MSDTPTIAKCGNSSSKYEAYPNFKLLLLYSSAFFVTLFAFFSGASIYSKILKEKGYGNLGFYGLAVLYVCLSISSLIAPSVASMLKS